MAMEYSAQIKGASTSASPDGAYVATLHNGHINIHSISSAELVLLRDIAVKSTVTSIKWSQNTSNAGCARLLYFNEDTIQVVDLDNPLWQANIDNGSAGMGKIVNAEFGRNDSEVLVYSDFGSKLTVWSLITGRNVEIRDPKFSTPKGRQYRKGFGIFTLLTRSNAQDVLSLHAPNSYKVIRSIPLPTVDAQGFKWSPDEKWIATWDTSSLGQKVYIFTADGNLFRTYTGVDESRIGSSGICAIDWSAAGQYLAIGGSNRRVTLLSTRTFSPVIFLDHTPTIQLNEQGQIWQEQVTASSKRSYITISQPYSPPTLPNINPNAVSKTGISIVAFDSSGSRLATRDDATPTAVWIWDLSKLAATAVLIHHSPVRKLAWHPTRNDLLLITCVQEEATLHIWNAKTSKPEVIQIPFQTTTAKAETRWIGGGDSNAPSIMIGNNQTLMIVWPEGREARSFDDIEEDSLDSVYEALVGQSAKKSQAQPTDHTELLVSEITEDISDTLEDTFVGRRIMGVTGR